jgi:excisionase family DNA binding protein
MLEGMMKSKHEQSGTPNDGLCAVQDGLASVADASRFLSVSRSKLYALMDAGELRYASIGRCRRIPWGVLRAFAARCLVGA